MSEQTKPDPFDRITFMARIVVLEEEAKYNAELILSMQRSSAEIAKQLGEAAALATRLMNVSMADTEQVVAATRPFCDTDESRAAFDALFAPGPLLNGLMLALKSAVASKAMAKTEASG